jgi:hypothetical protein
MSGKSELRLFDETLPQLVVESAAFVDVSPQTVLTDSNSKIDFTIHGTETEYLDLNDTLMYIRYQVKAAEGNKALADTSVVTPVNYLMNAIFSDVTLTLNDTIIEGGNQMYSYKSTIETIFGFNREAKKVKLRAMGYDDDEANRKKWITKSQVAELAGSLRLDFFNQPRYLLPGVTVKVSLTRNKDTFTLSGGGSEASRLILLDVKLYVRRVRVAPEVMLAHEKGLMNKNAIYPYTRGQVISYSISKGSLSSFRDNLFSASLLPKFLIVGFVKSAGFIGDDLSAAPFDFDHFHVNSVGLYRDGLSMPFRDIYQPGFGKTPALVLKDYVRSMIHNTQHLNTNMNNGIRLEDFESGKYTLFTFNLTPDFDMTQTQLPRDGNLRLEVKFAKELDTSINVIVYGMFDTQLEISKSREIICNHVR